MRPNHRTIGLMFAAAAFAVAHFSPLLAPTARGEDAAAARQPVLRKIEVRAVSVSGSEDGCKAFSEMCGNQGDLAIPAGAAPWNKPNTSAEPGLRPSPAPAPRDAKGEPPSETAIDDLLDAAIKEANAVAAEDRQPTMTISTEFGAMFILSDGDTANSVVGRDGEMAMLSLRLKGEMVEVGFRRVQAGSPAETNLNTKIALAGSFPVVIAGTRKKVTSETNKGATEISAVRLVILSSTKLPQGGSEESPGRDTH